jgi:anti-sigma B factor antagonist
VPRIAFEIDDCRVEGPSRGVVLVSASGEVDFAAGPRLKERLLAHLDGPGSTVVLDLSAVTFIDSMAIGVLVSVATRAQEIGGSLSVVCSNENERVLRIFDIAGVAGVIVLHRTLDDALAPPDGLAQRDLLDIAARDSAGEYPPSAPQPSRPTVARRYAPRGADDATLPPVGSVDGPGHVDKLA